MFLDIDNIEIGYMVVGFIFLMFSILMFFIGYRYYLRKSEYQYLAKDYHWGSFKGFWYRNNANIFIFLAFLFIIIGLALIVGSF